MQDAAATVLHGLARGVKPRQPLVVSGWADTRRRLSIKESPFPGQWRTSRVEALREPMDCCSARSKVRKVVLKFPIQFGKTAVAQNVTGYGIDHHPGPIMICLPGEVMMKKWIVQKLNTMIEETPAVKEALASTASRDSANQATFKDFRGGQLFVEHAGSPDRLAQTTVRTLIVDEVDKFAAALRTGDDPMALLHGRVSVYAGSCLELLISTPTLAGASRIDAEYEHSDQRRYYVACPDCGHRQPLEWSGLHWNESVTEAWYACRECGVCIGEHNKPQMLATGMWVKENPESKVAGFTINGLYYALGMGPRWLDLVHEWRAAQNDPARLKTFINDRLAEVWEDPAMRAVKTDLIIDRAEPYPIRTAPEGVLACTAGVDTQDNRLAVHITGWGMNLEAWTLDYVELPGDPQEDAVWIALTELLSRPIDHALGGVIRPEAVAIDAGGHRTEDVYHYVRSHMVRRPMAIFGAVQNNAPVLSRGKLVDVNWRGKLDKRGVHIHHVGTVAIKHWLYSRLAADAEKEPAERKIHISEDLPTEYFGGLVAEIFNPSKKRFEKRRGAPRNEPLDTWVYAYAAAHHPELRLHRLRKADWEARRKRLSKAVEQDEQNRGKPSKTAPSRGGGAHAPRGTKSRGGFVKNW